MKSLLLLVSVFVDFMCQSIVPTVIFISLLHVDTKPLKSTNLKILNVLDLVQKLQICPLFVLSPPFHIQFLASSLSLFFLPTQNLSEEKEININGEQDIFKLINLHYIYTE